MVKKLSLEQFKLQSRDIKVIYIGSYIPRECGIATFTKDLTTAINVLNPNNLGEIMAMDEPGSEERHYPWEVKYRLKDWDKECMAHAVHYINQSGCDVVNVQHEYGIFGANEGEAVVELLTEINRPIVVTLHTVLDDPSPLQKRIIQQMDEQTSVFVVMINEAKKRLIDIYGIEAQKVVVIPHGVPDIPFGPTQTHKKMLKLNPNQPMLSTFGLINRGKGIEYIIEAMKKVVVRFPRAQYLIIGQTHPTILKNEGEVYRNSLQAKIKKLRLHRNIKFVNKYLSIEELINYLRATDIYITPYLNPQQISSGTLAYAVGAGKACISTKYAYAKEVLAQRRGLLVDFENSDQIASSIIDLLSDQQKLYDIGMNAYLYGRKMTWPNVALSYIDLFSYLKQTNK